MNERRKERTADAPPVTEPWWQTNWRYVAVPANFQQQREEFLNEVARESTDPARKAADIAEPETSLPGEL